MDDWKEILTADLNWQPLKFEIIYVCADGKRFPGDKEAARKHDDKLREERWAMMERSWWRKLLNLKPRR